VLVTLHYPRLIAADVVRESVPWLPQHALELYFRMEGFAWLSALLVAVIGALVALFVTCDSRCGAKCARFP